MCASNLKWKKEYIKIIITNRIQFLSNGSTIFRATEGKIEKILASIEINTYGTVLNYVLKEQELERKKNDCGFYISAVRQWMNKCIKLIVV